MTWALRPHGVRTRGKKKGFCFGWFWLPLGFACVLFPFIMLCFFSFNDDLGTPPTWRPYSWKKRHSRIETSVAYLRKQSKLALVFDRPQKYCRQTAAVLGSRNGPQMVAKSSGHKQIKLRLNEWRPFWGPFLDPKMGAVLSANFSHRAKNSKTFDCFCTYATEVFHAAAFPWFCSAAGACSPHPDTCSCTGEARCGGTGFC